MKKFLGIAIAMLVISIYAIAQPNINSIIDFPDPVEVPGYNNITANITNAVQAYVEIYYPNTTLMGNYSMINIASINTWYYNNTYAYPDPLGNYSYVVKAYNATGWNVSSVYNFTIQDTTLPSSSVDALSKYWYNSTISITATANDNYNVSSITLKYRYSNDNSSWNSWQSFAVDSSPPWQWNFNFPGGEGYYRFLTLAKDDAGNVELWPTVYDENCGYDTTTPSSNIESMAYFYSSKPITINATASDSLSGVSAVKLYYRYSSDNATWGTWQNFATDSSAPYQWDFTAPNGDGYYEFYSIAVDNAGNEESKSTAEENVCLDTTPPSTVITASPSYGNHVTSNSVITLVASDAVTGVNATYYRIWNGSWHPAPGNGYGKSHNFYIYSGSFSLSKEGTNYVEYYSDDALGNEEAIHNKTYLVDDTPPIITNVVANPSMQTSGGKVNISCTIIDDTAIDGVYLEVTYPDDSFSNFTMYHIPCSTYYREEIYSIVGTYNFTIYAKDELGNANRSSVFHFSITTGNHPPNKPSKPSGAVNGITGTSYTYSTHTTDPDGDNVYYFFDWGDGSTTGWLGPFASGNTISTSHMWGSVGTYSIKVKAKDVNNAESEWSDSLTVTITLPNSPPVTSYSLTPSAPDGENGWYLHSVNVSLTATDPDGDAIAYTKYRIDGGVWHTYSMPFEISEEGDHILEFYSQDDKGNVESVKQAEIKIDKSKPYVSIERPLKGYLYLFNRQMLMLGSGNTIIIGRIVVRAFVYDSQSNIQNVSFYVDNILQNIDMAYPYEWLWRGAIGYHYISIEAYNKAGLKEKSLPMLVYIFSL